MIFSGECSRWLWMNAYSVISAPPAHVLRLVLKSPLYTLCDFQTPVCVLYVHGAVCSLCCLFQGGDSVSSHSSSSPKPSALIFPCSRFLVLTVVRTNEIQPLWFSKATVMGFVFIMCPPWCKSLLLSLLPACGVPPSLGQVSNGSI